MAMAYVKMFVDWADIISPLDDAERGRLLNAILYYAKTGFEPEMTGNERFLFPTFKAQIDRDSASYEEISRIRSEQGRKGGYAKAAKAAKGQNLAAQPSKAAQEKEKEKEEEKEKEKEKEKLSQSGPPRAALREQKDEARAARPAAPEDDEIVTDPERIRRYIAEVRREFLGGPPGRGPAHPW